MIEIKKASRELSKVERYRMTLSPEIQTMQTLEDDVVIEVKAFCVFADVDTETGEESELLSILSTDDIAYVTQSATFMKSFTDIADIFADEPDSVFSIRKISGTNKAGRAYVNCVLA